MRWRVSARSARTDARPYPAEVDGTAPRDDATAASESGGILAIRFTITARCGAPSWPPLIRSASAVPMSAGAPSRSNRSGGIGRSGSSPSASGSMAHPGRPGLEFGKVRHEPDGQRSAGDLGARSADRIGAMPPQHCGDELGCDTPAVRDQREHPLVLEHGPRRRDVMPPLDGSGRARRDDRRWLGRRAGRPAGQEARRRGVRRYRRRPGPASARTAPNAGCRRPRRRVDRPRPADPCGPCRASPSSPAPASAPPSSCRHLHRHRTHPNIRFA